MNKVEQELANFFVKVWYEFCEFPTEVIQDIIENSPLFEIHEITQEDVDDEAYEGDVGDTVFILTPLGEEARDLVEGAEEDEENKKENKDE